MVEEEMSKALDAIHDEALKLALRDELPDEVQDKLHFIVQLSRHKYDVRSEKEMQAGGEQWADRKKISTSSSTSVPDTACADPACR